MPTLNNDYLEAMRQYGSQRLIDLGKVKAGLVDPDDPMDNGQDLHEKHVYIITENEAGVAWLQTLHRKPGTMSNPNNVNLSELKYTINPENWDIDKFIERAENDENLVGIITDSEKVEDALYQHGQRVRKDTWEGIFFGDRTDPVFYFRK